MEDTCIPKCLKRAGEPITRRDLEDALPAARNARACSVGRLEAGGDGAFGWDTVCIAAQRHGRTVRTLRNAEERLKTCDVPAEYMYVTGMVNKYFIYNRKRVFTYRNMGIHQNSQEFEDDDDWSHTVLLHVPSRTIFDPIFPTWSKYKFDEIMFEGENSYMHPNGRQYHYIESSSSLSLSSSSSSLSSSTSSTCATSSSDATSTLSWGCGHSLAIKVPCSPGNTTVTKDGRTTQALSQGSFTLVVKNPEALYMIATLMAEDFPQALVERDGARDRATAAEEQNKVMAGLLREETLTKLQLREQLDAKMQELKKSCDYAESLCKEMDAMKLEQDNLRRKTPRNSPPRSPQPARNRASAMDVSSPDEVTESEETKLLGRLQGTITFTFHEDAIDLPSSAKEQGEYREAILALWKDPVGPILFIQLKHPRSRLFFSGQLGDVEAPSDQQYATTLVETANDFNSKELSIPQSGLLHSRHGPRALEKLACIEGAIGKIRTVVMDKLKALIFRGGEASVEEVGAAVAQAAEALTRTLIPWNLSQTLFGTNWKGGYYALWVPLRLLCLGGVVVKVTRSTTWPQVVKVCGVQTQYKVVGGVVVPEKEEDKATRMGKLVEKIQRSSPYDWLAARSLLHVNLLYVSIVLCMDFKMK